MSDILTRACLGHAVVEVNSELADAPERLNEDPYGEGWICVIALSDPDSLGDLMDASAYRDLVEG